MSDFKTEDLNRRFPVKAAYIQSLATVSSLYDANAVALERLPSTDPEIVLWTVSVPARDTKRPELFGVVVDARQELTPINRAFCDDPELFQPLIKACTNAETLSIIERIKTAAGEYEFSPVSDPSVLLGFDRDWKGQRPRDFDFPLLERRSRDRAAGERARIAARNWKPDSFQGDSEAITQEAVDRLARRRKQYGWTILRIQDPETAGELTELTAFLKQHVFDFEVAQLDYESAADEAGKVIYSRKILPFYKHHRLYEIFDHRHARPRRTRFLFSPDVGSTGADRLIPLAGTISPISDLTQKSHCRLEGDELVEYVAFLGDHVAGENGSPFSVVETTDDLSWRTHQHGSQIEKILAASIFPLRLWPEAAPLQAENPEAGESPNAQTGARLVDGFVRYNAGFSHVVYSVQTDGKIDMIEDDEILRALPARLSLLDFDNQFLIKQSVP